MDITHKYNYIQNEGEIMTTGNTTDDKRREKIKALLSTGIAKNQVAKQVGCSWATVDKISKEEPDEIENMREIKRTQFIDRLWRSMDSALKLADKRIALAIDANQKLDQLSDMVGDSDLDPKKQYELQKAIENISSVPLGQISTFIGTIYDKHALMTGGKTQDIGLTYEDQLKKLLGG